MTTEDQSQSRDHDGNAFTPEEAEAMLRRLSKHFKEPVMPIGRYCAALQLWQCALREKFDWLKSKLAAGETKIPMVLTGVSDDSVFKEWSRNVASELESAKQLSNDVDHVFRQITKSNLLSRLLYSGESLRTKRCPAHQGFWSGCSSQDEACGCQKMQNGSTDSNVTGWLP